MLISSPALLKLTHFLVYKQKFVTIPLMET